MRIKLCPPNHEHLLLFIAYLAYYRKLTFSAIKSYIYGVRDWALTEGRRDPTKGSGKQRHWYQKLLRGIKRARTGKKRTRKPMKRKQLLRILNATSYLSAEESSCFKAALTLAFYGFLRVSEYTYSPANRTFLRRSDIKFSKAHLSVKLRKSKTDQFSKSVVRICGNNKLDCPVTHMKDYLRLNYNSKDSSLFIFRRKPLTPKIFNKVFRNLVHRSGLNPKNFSSHSLRSGAASTETECGVLEWLIQKLGRWKSGCYKIYIPDPKKAKFKAQLAMSNY